ncbi:MAG: hydrolase [candidate division Zixibacteria bacterium]|nr:hydrolase [candidate division Zixibacteria bacterium]
MLKVEDAALVIVDVQGKLAALMHEKDKFFDNLVKTAKCAQVLDIPILWNEQLPDKLGSTIPQLQDILGDLKPLVKDSFSCCGNHDFTQKLISLNRNQVLLCGMETHVCVYQTAVDLLQSGYEVHLLADAVSSRTLDNKQIGIEATKNAGANITCLEMAVFEMLQIAKGNKFKQVIKILK